MAVHLHTEPFLVTNCNAGDRPIAFLVGSALSTDRGHGVPAVAGMIELVRDEIRARAAACLRDFERDVRGKQGGAAYQAAMTVLQGCLGPAGVARVVRQAVLTARRAGSAAGFESDGDPNDWYIPSGVRQLAELVVRHPDQFRGPILTTNFDPLITLAVDAAGGRSRLRVIDSDGGLTRDVERRHDEVEVVHLHGHWRADTLHTPAQLAGQRPELAACLQRLLVKHALLVVGYGGWDDVFADALSKSLQNEDAFPTVYWCFHESAADNVATRYQKLFERVAPAITRGRFLCYGGIDCHAVFGRIAAGLGTSGISTSATSTEPGVSHEGRPERERASRPPPTPESASGQGYRHWKQQRRILFLAAVIPLAAVAIWLAGVLAGTANAKKNEKDISNNNNAVAPPLPEGNENKGMVPDSDSPAWVDLGESIRVGDKLWLKRSLRCPYVGAMVEMSDVNRSLGAGDSKWTLPSADELDQIRPLLDKNVLLQLAGEYIWTSDRTERYSALGALYQPRKPLERKQLSKESLAFTRLVRKAD